MGMKIQAGDSITIPEGFKAIVKDGSVVFEREKIEEVQEFKDGDVLHSVYSDITLIFEKYKTYYSFTSHYSTLNAAGFDWAVKSFRHATEEEKSEFFDKMKEQGLQWNAEEKKVEKTRWRARRNEIYYYVKEDLTVTNTIETYNSCDNKRWGDFNYFKVEGQAEHSAKRIRETLRQYHEEIGE